MPGKQDLSCLFKEIGRSWRNAAVVGRVDTAVHVCTGGWCKFSQSVNATHAIRLLTPKYSWASVMIPFQASSERDQRS